MAIGFGFSVGDVIAGIGVIKASIGAFSDTRGATKDHKLLCDTLTGLGEALEVIREIEIEPFLDARQREAIGRAVKQCQSCIDDFVCTIAKYKILQPGLQPAAWKSKVKTAVKKVQWALCTKEDIVKFRGHMQLQFDAVSVLLVSLQVHRQTRETSLVETYRKEDREYRDVLLRSHSTMQSTEEMCYVSQSMISSQGATLENLKSGNDQILDRSDEQLSVAQDTQALIRALQNTLTGEQSSLLQHILQQQARNLRLIIDAQAQSHQLVMSSLNAVSAQIQLQTEIPPQVLLQQPVVFRDALDRVTPVHLEFIDSAEAFLAVLKIRFKDLGLKKVEKKEYLLSDEKQKRKLDIRKPWCTVMKPGQHVSMSMVFDAPFEQNLCPGCSSANEAKRGEETCCINCGLTYRLVEETIAQPTRSRGYTRKQKVELQSGRTFDGSKDGDDTNTAELESGAEAIIADFRRVHLNWIHIGGSLEAEKRSQDTKLAEIDDAAHVSTNPQSESNFETLPISDALHKVIQEEIKTRWILDTGFHFPKSPDREKMFVNFRPAPNRSHRVTISVDYLEVLNGSLEEELQRTPLQRDRSAIIYANLRDSLPDILFYDTVTNLMLQTADGRLLLHVTEDIQELRHGRLFGRERERYTPRYLASSLNRRDRHSIDNRNHGEHHEQGSPQTKKAAGEKKEKAKKSKELRQAPRTVINTTGASFSMVSGGTVRGNSYIQYGPKSQQRWQNKGEKMDSESEDDSDTSDDSSD